MSFETQYSEEDRDILKNVLQVFAVCMTLGILGVGMMLLAGGYENQPAPNLLCFYGFIMAFIGCSGVGFSGLLLITFAIDYVSSCARRWIRGLRK